MLDSMVLLGWDIVHNYYYLDSLLGSGGRRFPVTLVLSIGPDHDFPRSSDDHHIFPGIVSIFSAWLFGSSLCGMDTGVVVLGISHIGLKERKACRRIRG